jgi:glucose/arabinose dehydrogenase
VAHAYIYFVYSYNSGKEVAPVTRFRIKRLKWDEATSTVIEDTNIVNQLITGFDYYGGRLLAAKQDGISYLFVSIGDNGRSVLSSPDCYVPQSTNPNNFTQDISTQNGKIHRFHMDGTIPADNPVGGNSFYTRGHRNPQGLIYHPTLEIIYAVEHGDRTDDEINILQKGMNYGWKDVQGYHDGNYEDEMNFIDNYMPHPMIANDALVAPIYSWCTVLDSSNVWTDWCSVAPSGGDYYGSAAISEWTNSLLVVTLKNGATTDRELFQFQLSSNGTIVPSTIEEPNPKRFFGEDQGMNGRLRDLAISPCGQTLYLINNSGTDRDKITVYKHQSVGIQSPDTASKIALTVHSNPVINVLKIKGFDQLTDHRNIQIVTVGGQIILLANEANIDVSALKKGLYFVQIIDANAVYSLRFVKE